MPFMKKLILIASTLVLASCSFIGLTYKVGNAISAESIVRVGQFTDISSCCSVDVIYTQEPEAQYVLLTCDSNLVDYYDIHVEGSTLVVDTKYGASISARAKTFVTVTSPKLNGVKVSGSGDVRITNDVVTDADFTIKLSGSGDLDAEGTVTCRNFSCSVSGSGDVDVFGVKTGSAGFKDSGSGSIEVERLTAETVSVKMTGSGGVNLVCNNAGDIEADLSGSGNLNLSGSARSLRSNASGSGRVNSKNLVL